MKNKIFKPSKKNEKIKKWVNENYQKNPELKIELRADELFELLNQVCYEQYEIDCRKFNEELKGIFGSGESDKETPKA